MQRWREGGRDPLDHVLVFARDTPVPHWHYIGVGLSHGAAAPTGDAGPDGDDGGDGHAARPAADDGRGWDFELTARLARDGGAGPGEHEHPPAFMADVLQNLARYVAETGNPLGPGDTMDLFGPIRLGSDTPVGHVFLVDDPELGDAPDGSGTSAEGVAFLQVVGLTADEAAAKKSWTRDGFVVLFAQQHPLLVTRLERESILADPAVRSALAAGRERDGSTTSGMAVRALAVEHPTGPLRRLRRRPATVHVDASMVEALCLLLPLRIPFGRSFRVTGSDVAMTFLADPTVGLHEHEPGHWLLGLSGDQARAVAAALAPRAGVYPVAGLPDVRFEVHPAQVLDQRGEVIATVG